MHKTPHFSICVVTLMFMCKIPHLCVFMLIFQIQCCPDWEHHIASVHGAVEFKCTASATVPSQTVPQPRHFGGVQEILYKHWSCNSRQLLATWTTPKMLHSSSSLKWGKLRSSCGNEFQKLVIFCRSASRTEIICVCIPIPKELTWLQRLSKEVGTLRSIPLKAKDYAACVVLEMQKSLHLRYTKCSQTKALFPARIWSLTFYKPWFKQANK